MPAKFDRMVSKIWTGMRGKRNPRTNKPFTRSDAYAIATVTWKKAHGGKAPGREDFNDWHIMEFFVPITEARSVGDDFLINGIAINETTTRNGIRYIASELEKAAPSFRGKPILLDHKNEINSIVGRTTDNVNFNSMKKGIEFEAKIMDKGIQSMITDGRITDVSIGAKVQDLEHDKKENTMTAIGLEGLEISLVAVPGDPGANLASAMENSFSIREMMMNDEEPVNYLNNEKEVDKMAEEEKKQPEAEAEKPAEEEVEAKAEEPEKDTEATEENLKLRKEILDLKFENKVREEVAKRLKEQEDTTPPTEEPKEEEKSVEEEKSEPEDETKGVVGEPEKEEEATEEGLVIEKADTGKGFQIYRDYSKTAERFNRLVRE